MLKWAVGTDERRRREWNLYKRRRSAGKVALPVDPHEPFAKTLPAFNQFSLNNKRWKETEEEPFGSEFQKGSQDEGKGESKSLFYMTLDHLPLAILKQCERMLQETGEESQQSHNNKPIKAEEGNKKCGTMGLVMCESQGPKVKEALHRPLKVANVRNHHHDTILLSNQKYSDSEGESSSTSSDIWGEFCPNGAIQNKKESEKAEMSRKSNRIKNVSQGEKRRDKKSDENERIPIKGPETKLNFNPLPLHDKIRGSKLSLKRRELRKLEKLRGESEELSNFLRKYYSDCLPKLPPEEEGDGSPEEKSLLTSFLDQLTSRMRDWDKDHVKLDQRTKVSSTSSSTSTTMSDTSTESSTPTEDDEEIGWGILGNPLPMIPEDPELSSSDTNRTKDPHIPIVGGGVMKIISNNGEVNGTGDEGRCPFDSPPRAQQLRIPSFNFTPDITNYSPGDNHFTPPSSSRIQNPPAQSPWKRQRKRRGGRLAVGVKMKNIKSPSTKTGGVGEVLVRSQWVGNSLTLNVLEVRNLTRFPSTSTSPTWKLSFKVSYLPGDSVDYEEKVSHAPWLEVKGGERRLSIQQKFSFITSPPSTDKGRAEGKFFITFWKRGQGKRSSLLGWTSKEVRFHQEETPTKTKGDLWLRLRRDKMRKNHLVTMDNQMSHQEGQSPYDLPDLRPPGHTSSLINSTTMDSGVEDCCNSRTGPPSSHLIFNLKKGNGEEGFGFTVIWCSPPQIGRIKERTAAERSGLRTGDLILRVNGEDIAPFPKEIVIHKMQWNGDELELEVERDVDPECDPNYNHNCQFLPLDSNTPSPPIPYNGNNNVHKISSTIHNNGLGPICHQRTFVPPPLTPRVSILKPPPPPVPLGENKSREHPPEPRPVGTSWKIRFNVEFLEKEDEIVKEFLLTELKFFRKVVAALDRYLIPAQANCLLTNAELSRIFSHLIKIITITKRILDCVSQGGGALGEVLLRTHSDHLVELLSGYSSYAKNLGSSASLLAEKMRFQLFAEFVVETPVPKGHLDMTSLLFAPLEHLRNLCEIGDEILLVSPEWTSFAHQLKECYADIVCQTDFMEPISHVSMKKQPLLSVRHLEKRIVSTKFQEFKVCEKGRRWLFGSRLFRKESDGTFSPVWAFLFTDLLVLTSHHTRTDRVFFVKDAPVKLQDVTTLHFNIPKKHENEFRLSFGGEIVVPQSRLDRLLHKGKAKKPPQLILRTPNTELKSIWKLLLQRQIIVLNTRLSKSSSSNFSISEFCEKFPERDPEEEEVSPQVTENSICQENQGQEVRERLRPMTPPPKFNEVSLSPKPTVPNEDKVVGIGGVEEGTHPEGVADSLPLDGAEGGKVEECPETTNTESQCPEITNTQPQCPETTNAQPPTGAQSQTSTTCPSPRRRAKKVVVHKDSPMIGEGRRRILYDCKVRKDYPELFGISPRDRRSFIKSLGQKVKQNVEEEGGQGMVTPYYYISPAPSPLPVQKNWRRPPGGHPSPMMSPLTPVRRVMKEMTPDSLPLGRLDLVEEERERSPEESSSNDSGISDDPGQCPLTHPGGTGFLRKSEVTTTSALTRVLENHQPETQGEMARLVGVSKVDKATETDEPMPHHPSPPLSHPLTNHQRRLAFFQGHIDEGRSDLPPKPLPPEPFIVKIVNGPAVPMSPLTRPRVPHVMTFQVDRGKTAEIEYSLLEEVRVAQLERVESSEDSNESTSSDVASASPAGNENGTTDPSWSSSSSSLAKEETPGRANKKPSPVPMATDQDHRTKGPQILITKESPTEDGGGVSNESTVENFGDDDEEEDYFDEEDEDFSHSSVVSMSMNRYGTYESLERLENEDLLTGLPEFCRTLPRSKARFAFDEEDEEGGGLEEEEDLFEEDFESDFNFRFPSQVQDNTYSVSRLGPLPPLLEEDYEEDEMYQEGGGSNPAPEGGGPSTSSAPPPSRVTTNTGLRRGENSFLLSRIATMYARSSISPLKIFRDLWLKKRYREWGGYKG